MRYLPNILTIIRLFLVPLFPLAYFSDQLANGPYVALAIYVLAGVTDILDGHLARKYNLVTRIGTVLDPLADKLMLISALLTLTVDRLIPVFLVVLVIAKELFMIVIGMILYFRKDKFVIPSNRFGKTATVIFFVAVLETVIYNIHWLSLLLFSTAILIKVTALYTYMRHYQKSHSIQT